MKMWVTKDVKGSIENGRISFNKNLLNFDKPLGTGRVLHIDSSYWLYIYFGDWDSFDRTMKIFTMPIFCFYYYFLFLLFLQVTIFKDFFLSLTFKSKACLYIAYKYNQRRLYPRRYFNHWFISYLINIFKSVILNIVKILFSYCLKQ